MAKWGEGDPRWIVEERPDATNVNNWHWSEKNATSWSRDRLNQLFNELKIDYNNIQCTISKIDQCTGEATANNRKGKLIFFYEWFIDLKWSGRLDGSENEHQGKVTIPNLSEENDLNEVEITITIEESNDESEQLKLFMYNIGRDKIRNQLGLYIKELKEEFAKGLILPRKGDELQQQVLNKHNDGLAKTINSNMNVTKTGSPHQTANKNNIGCKLDVKSLKMTVKFQCNANDLYNALTKSEMLSAFTRGPVKIEAVRGGEFILYGGNVNGKFEELVPEKRLKQTWRLKNWPSGHYSNVEIEFEEEKDQTKMTLRQSGIPSSEYDAMKSNWHRYYWHSIKQTFGFGPALMNAL